MGAEANKGEELRKIQKIKMKMLKIKHEVPLKIEKNKLEAEVEERKLVREFRKQKIFRAPQAEMQIANFITLKQNIIKIYEITKWEIEKLLRLINDLTNIETVQKMLYNSFNIILYSQSILNDPTIDQLCRYIKKRCPGIKQASDDDVNCDIMKFHKKQVFPAPCMTNQYLLNLVFQENLNLEEITMDGKHVIQYGI